MFLRSDRFWRLYVRLISVFFFSVRLQLQNVFVFNNLDYLFKGRMRIRLVRSEVDLGVGLKDDRPIYTGNS